MSHTYWVPAVFVALPSLTTKILLKFVVVERSFYLDFKYMVLMYKSRKVYLKYFPTRLMFTHSREIRLRRRTLWWCSNSLMCVFVWGGGGYSCLRYQTNLFGNRLFSHKFRPPPPSIIELAAPLSTASIEKNMQKWKPNKFWTEL